MLFWGVCVFVVDKKSWEDGSNSSNNNRSRSSMCEREIVPEDEYEQREIIEKIV